MTDSFDPCPVARSLDLLGDRWTLLILRDLLKDQPCRFQDFVDSLRGASPNTISLRLKRLQGAGLICRTVYDTHPPRADYRLTQRGERTAPIIRAFFDWGTEVKQSGQSQTSVLSHRISGKRAKESADGSRRA